MGIDISKLTKLVTDICSEVRCKSDCCHEAMLCECDNKDHDVSRDSNVTITPSELSQSNKLSK